MAQIFAKVDSALPLLSPLLLVVVRVLVLLLGVRDGSSKHQATSVVDAVHEADQQFADAAGDRKAAVNETPEVEKAFCCC